MANAPQHASPRETVRAAHRHSLKDYIVPPVVIPIALLLVVVLVALLRGPV
ncbi:hypothetical protein [Azospirillum halopraeferens]|uniref:hypothetical protein n=1 Tax=Azospirillum halopraeferens TaxID=34010 RepID=UPI0012EB6D82|nr:hypothetical protein [Azospirillum halopraeferens]